MLKVRDLSISVSGKTVIKKVDLDIEKGKVVVLFGPNGSGKTSLIKTIMGFSGHDITGGEIIFKGRKINDLPIDERVRMGMGMMYQNPPDVRGVKLHQVARHVCGEEEKIKGFAERLSLEEHLDRDVNLDFSGGEMKRSELFQVMLQDPDLVLLDEPESGVDLENISIMGGMLNDFLKKGSKAALVITHTGYILDYVKADEGCVLLDKEFCCVGDPRKIFDDIKNYGYEKCRECECPMKKT